MPDPAARPALMVAPALMIAVLGCRDDTSRLTEPPSGAPAQAAGIQPLLFRQVTTGQDHSCGVTRDNVAYCWGDNGSGQLGVGTTSGPESCHITPCSTRPVRVRGDHQFRQVSAEGRFHTCGVTTTNVAYCWGSNGFGQLGVGSVLDSDRPVRVAGGLAFRQVSVGALHTCGVTTQNVAYCWGHNQAGPLGNGSTAGSSVPGRVTRRLSFREVTSGEQFTCGITTDYRAYCWGVNGRGELGIGDVTGPEQCFTGDGDWPCSTRPVRVVRGLSFRSLDAGISHVCGVTRDDLAYCWGSNGYGELGHRTNSGPDDCGFGSPCSTRPVRVAGRLRFASTSGGANYTCGVITASLAYCWGINSSGELGVGSRQGPEACHIPFVTPDEGEPCSTKPVPVLGNHAFGSVATGNSFGCGVKTTGVAFCWGNNNYGQLGDGTTQPRLRPRRVADPG